MALAGCYGSPVFDILFGLGLAICVSTAKLYPEPFAVSLDGSSYISIGFLYLTLLSTIFICSYRGWRIEKGFGYFLYGVYAAYTVVQVLFMLSA
jgi:sodium/potassium/calcium exchanger 6